MSIAIQRIKRAIQDMPTGGMQTGNSRVKLEYSDAQRAIVEIEALQTERDALLAKLAAVKNAETTGALIKAIEAIPQHCLSEIRAEAGRAGYLQGHLDAGGDYGKLHKKLSEYYADKYAKKIRQGGAKC